MRTHHITTRKHGFTLIELVISLGLSSIFIVLVYQFLIVNQQFFSSRKGVVEVVQNGRIAMDRMTRELRESETVTTCSFPSSEIEFEETQTGETIRYHLTGMNLMRERKTPSGQTIEDEVLARFVQSIQFSGNCLTLIEISLTVSDNNQSVPLYSKVFRRNN